MTIYCDSKTKNEYLANPVFKTLQLPVPVTFEEAKCKEEEIFTSFCVRCKTT